MNVREFKEYLKEFDDKNTIVRAMMYWINNIATDYEIESICRIALEKACLQMNYHGIRSEALEQQLTQTKMYLKGEMYKDEETAKEMLYKQIENIERVLGK